MADKRELLSKLYEDTTLQVTKSVGNWTDFLTVVGNLYKYPYHEQLMIYAQKPKATACAEYDFWNEKMNRYVKRGTTGIALIDPTTDKGKVTYVFDAKDTGGKEHARKPYLWSMEEAYEQPIIEMFQKQFDIYENDLYEGIDKVANKLASEYYMDSSYSIMQMVENSYLEDLDDLNLRLTFEHAVCVSISYTLMKRMGLDTTEHFTHEDFLSIFDFNTPATISLLGTAVSEQTEQVFREIAKIIVKEERSIQNEPINVQTRGGLQDSELRDAGARELHTGEIRENEERTSRETSQAIVSSSIVERETFSSSSGNRQNSQRETGTDYEESREETNSTKQNDTSNGVGSLHEQSASTSRRDDSKGVSVQLESSKEDTTFLELAEIEQISIFPTEEEQIQNIADRQGELLPSQSAISFESRKEADKLARCVEHFFNEIDTKYKGTIIADMPELKALEHTNNKKKNLTLSFTSPVADMGENAFTYFNVADKSDEIAMNEAIYNSSFLSQFKEDKDFSISFTPTNIYLFFNNFEDKVIDYTVAQNVEKGVMDIDPKSVTPFYEEYLNVKNEYPNAIVLYPLGNFLESFGNDARTMEEMFDLKISYRVLDDSGERIPMVGIPKIALENYVKKLRDDGRDVVIANYEKEEMKLTFMGKEEVTQKEHQEITQEDIDHAILEWNGDEESKARVLSYMRERGRERETAKWLQNEYGNHMPSLLVEKGDLSEMIPWVKVQRQLSKLIEEDKFFVIDTLNAPKEVVQQVLEVKAENFHITDSSLGIGTKSEKIKSNIDAITTLQLVEGQQQVATLEEKEILSRFVGFGGLQEVFEEQNPHYRELKGLLDEDEYAKARASVLNAHYTSPIIIKAIYDTIENMGFTTGNILEPSCGVGNFFGMLPDSMEKSNLYGVELDSITGRIAKQLYPNATIAINGFEKMDLPDSFFDVAIGNVPFGDYSLNEKRYENHKFKIHDHFFAKSLDKVRPNGIVAFVTSKGTLDKQNPQVRKYLAQQAELLGAIRLPNNAFKENAGTEVTSDIIFLQKREHPVDIQPDWVHLGHDENMVPMNSYFVEHPEMILGTMELINGRFGEETVCLPIEGADLGQQLEQARKHIVGKIPEIEFLEVEQEKDTSIPADPNVKNYSYTVLDDKVYYRENSKMIEPKVNGTALERIKGMVTIRESVNELIQLQLEEYADSEIKEAQEKLNKVYDEFSSTYGLLNHRSNANAFLGDNSYYLLASLEEVNEDGTLKAKADMFTKRTIKPIVKVTSVDTSSEALAISISEKAKIDMEFMSDLTGKNEEELFEDLKGVLFLNPFYENGTSLVEKYVTADEYLSGNVREKLEVAKRSVALQGDMYVMNVEALEKAQPKDLDASEIEVRLGATWISKEYVEQFMYELLETPFWSRGEQGICVKFANFTGEWSIRNKNSAGRRDVASTSTYGTSRANAYRILEDTLNLRDIRIYDTIEDVDGKEKRVLNKNETTLAQQKQQVIKDKFKEWIWNNPDRRQHLVRFYNDKFNSTRPREYDGSHITFGGINPEIKLREHQVNAIAHILYGNNVLLAHEVGAGKSFEMVAGAMESKRLGLCNKPLIAVPNHLTEQMASEFLRLYPAANILVATRKDFETHNRKKFCARIATGDYDAVIIGHSQFERIPISNERQERLLDEQITEITNGIMEIKASGGEKFTIKQLERTKKGLEKRLEKLQALDRKDDVVTFEQLGVDKLIVDEAHAYKNGFVFTKMRNVAGLGSTESQRSADMFMKCRYLDEITGGKGVVFATGTPVSNSMTELYVMQRYLQYNTLKETGLLHFDAWASTFGETTTTLEINPQGSGYRARTRFAKFFNLPELMNLFKEVADIKTADQLNLPTPEIIYETVSAKPTQLQKEIVEQLSKRASKVQANQVDPSIDNMLTITNDGRKLGLDQRVFNPLLPDDPDSKVNTCISNIYNIWEETKEERLTQLLFCDLSTPKSKPKDSLKVAKTENMGSNGAEVNALEHGIEIVEESMLVEKEMPFSVYHDIKDKLIELGIPKEEIAFIHDATTEVQKKELFARVRNGDVRVMLGSTAKCGAGMNVQDRLVALHDLDAPWRPGDLRQRSGRIERQGNQNEQAKIFRYVTDSTFDAYLWQTLENKQKFISQIMTSKSPVRSCDDLDESALSFAEIKALCAGNPKIKLKMDLDIEVAKLKLLKASHQSTKFRLEDQLITYFPQQIALNEGYVKGFKQDLETLATHTPRADEFLPMEIKGDKLVDKDNAGAALLACVKEVTGSEGVEIGTYRGFGMQLSYDSFHNKHTVTLKGAMSHPVELGEDIRGNLTRIDNVLAMMEKRLESVVVQLENLHKQQSNAEIEKEKSFPNEQELKEKSEQLAQLDAELNLGNSIGEELEEDSKAIEKYTRPSVLSNLKVASKEKGEPKAKKQKREER